MVDGDFKRDRWGRPVIPQADGADEAYVRVSSLAGALDDKSNLIAWENRLTSVGLGLTPSLMNRVQSIINKAKPGEQIVREYKRELNVIYKEAQKAAGRDHASDEGSALHEHTEVIDAGGELRVVPERYATHLENYAVLMRKLEILEIEMPVVNDEIKAAGTFDRLLRLPDGRVVVGDLKTGASDPSYPLKVCIQIATYANGEKFDPVRGERLGPLHPDLDPKMGLLIHMPASDPEGPAVAYELDLVAGYRAAQLARDIYDFRKIKPAELCKPLFLN